MQATAAEPATEIGHPIVFFDGVCGLCNHFVDFLVRHDREQVLRFAPIQGETSEQLCGHLEVIDTIIFRDQGKLYYRSDAAIRILATLGGRWVLAKAGYVFPALLRDWLYDRLANNRYRIFGKKDACRLPAVHEKHLFFD